MKYSVGTFPFAANSRARATGSSDGMVKIISDEATDRCAPPWLVYTRLVEGGSHTIFSPTPPGTQYPGHPHHRAQRRGDDRRGRARHGVRRELRGARRVDALCARVPPIR